MSLAAGIQPPPPTAPGVDRLTPYIPGKPVEEVRRELGLTDVVKLASNENPLGPSPLALEAARQALNQVEFYPEGAAPQLIEALSAHLQIPAGCLVAGNGSDELIHYLGLAYLHAGLRLLTGDPTFVRYEAAALLNQADYLAVPLSNYRYDLPAMAQRLSPACRLVFIANPNNPTGTYVTRAELEAFLDRTPPETLVVLDEAYFEYVDRPDYPNGIEYVRQGRNVAVLRTFSKIYALAGLRVGYCVARPEVIRAIHQVREPFNVNSAAQAAAVASLADPDQVARSRRQQQEERDYLCSEFDRLGVDFLPTQTNFIIVDTGAAPDAVFQALLRRGVIVRSGSHLGLPHHIRVTVGLARQNRLFVAALQEVLAELPRRSG